MLIKYAGEDFNNLISEGLVLVDFFATWCGPCKMIGPHLESLANNRDDVKVIMIDVDQYRDLAVEYQVSSIPSLVLLNDGKVISRRTGFASENQLSKWIDDNK